MKVKKFAFVAAVAMASSAAMAAETDYAGMLAKVDYTAVIAAILAIGAIIAGKDIAISGVKNLIRMIRGA